jgi:tetratricopeptide (TPR) repeat protein/CHAT domain-containing protein
MRSRTLGPWLLLGASLLTGAIGTVWLVSSDTKPALVQPAAEQDQLMQQATALYRAGKYADAIPLLERHAEAVKSQRGADHPDYATALNTLGQALHNADRLADAEPIMRRALAVDEKSLGLDHPSVARDLSNLARLLQAANRHAEAEPLYHRAATILESSLGPETPDLAAVLNNLAALLRDTHRVAEAEPLFRRALAIDEKALGPDHPGVAFSLVNLGDLLETTNRHTEAEPLYRRALAIDETALGPDHPGVARDLKYLAGSLQATNRHDEAEPLYRRAVSIIETRLGPESPNLATLLNDLAALLRATNRLAEAEPLIRRALDIAEKARGPDHAEVAGRLRDLADLLRATNRDTEAEPLYRRALAITERSRGQDAPDDSADYAALQKLYDAGRFAEAAGLAERLLSIREKALGPDHPQVGVALNRLGLMYVSQGRFAEAEPLYRRSLAITEKALGHDHPDVADTLNNLAGLYLDQGRFAEAEPLLKRGLAVREKALGPDHRDVGASLNSLGLLYVAQGRLAEAEPVYRRSLAIGEKALGPEHFDVSTTHHNLGQLYQLQGRFAEAEPLFRRGLAIRERALGPDHPYVGESLSALAELYQRQGRLAEAEPLLKRSAAILEKSLGPDNHQVGISLGLLAELYREQNRFAEAEPFYRRSLAILEKALGADHQNVGTALNNMSMLHWRAGRLDEAESLLRRSIAISEKVLGQHHPDVGTALNNLALLHLDQKRFADAEQVLARSLTIFENTVGPDHPLTSTAFDNLASLGYLKSDWAQAIDYWRRSTGIIKRRTERGLVASRGAAAAGEARRATALFSGLVKAAYRFGAGNPAPALSAEMFETAQWAQASDAAASLAQMAARSAKGSPQLAALVRERQDLVVEWEDKDKLLIAAKSEEPAKRKPGAETMLAERLAAIDSRLAEIDRGLVKEFPDYASLASSTPASVAEVQAHLGADEALVLFFDTPQVEPLPEESFIWIVTRSEVRWVRSDLGTAALGREVAALRCGLDAAAWNGAGSERCAKALGMISPDRTPDPLPFNHARAHRLYMSLFGEVQDLIKGKHLLIVPSGPLTQLPFQVLVTERPESGDDRAVVWLARGHALTILPAVSSLKALRRVGKSSAAPRPLIGFGNPLLDGPDQGYADNARLARDRGRCPEVRPQRAAARVALRSGVARIEMPGGLATPAQLKMQVPLPETADELCTVAQEVKADTNDIRLGARASEREVKRLSASGELAKYRIVHFATHGALAGELSGTREPGLVLTPPQTASQEDDGYLSASEIASLKLDADWVILSACNTAAGAAMNAEALSGLARAFIYAQARALLVSHWAVDSDATVKLVTASIAEIARDAKVGRAEALRRAMLALIDKGGPNEAQPAYWAPFIVVGEGAAR